MRTSSPMPRAFKPVEDVGASGVVDLVKWVCIGLLHGHCIARNKTKAKGEKCQDIYLPTDEAKTCPHYMKFVHLIQIHLRPSHVTFGFVGLLRVLKLQTGLLFFF